MNSIEFIATLATLAGIGLYGFSEAKELEMKRIEKGYSVQEKDLNNNGMPETFYEINNRKYFSRIDGQDLEESLKQ